MLTLPLDDSPRKGLVSLGSLLSVFVFSKPVVNFPVADCEPSYPKTSLINIVGVTHVLERRGYGDD